MKQGRTGYGTMQIWIREIVKRGAACGMAAVLGLMTAIPWLPPFTVHAADGSGRRTILTSAYGDTDLGHKLYCIDRGGLALWGIADDGDVYECHRPSEASVPLSEMEKRYVFWAMVTQKAAMGDDKAGRVMECANAGAQAKGWPVIDSRVSEEDLKELIYLSSTRARYPWLEFVAGHSESYMEMGGLIGTGNSTVGGKNIPEILSGALTVSSALKVNGDTGILSFDPSGADAEFIRTVPMEFSTDGGVTYSAGTPEGWSILKTDTEIHFTATVQRPPSVLIRFGTEGTPYESGGGSGKTEKEVLDSCLEIWECVDCSGNHRGGTPPSSPVWEHQRMVWLEVESCSANYYAMLGGQPAGPAADGQLAFQIYRHEEEFKSHYNVQLEKYDYETGKPLEGARFALLERFDDQEAVDRERDGGETLYEGGAPYAGGYKDKPAVWDGFRQVASLVTDESGHIARTVIHGYRYDKTFCNGHPAPQFVPVPEPEEDEETGEILNEDEIEEARSRNRQLAETWMACREDCDRKAEGDFSGVHFHWIMEQVFQGKIEEISHSGGEEGEIPDGGEQSDPGGEVSFQKSGCQADCEATYKKFISMKYSYTFREFQARDGYILHGNHPDDLPVEVIVTDASENGAHGRFAGEYSENVIQGKGGSGAEISDHALPRTQAAAGVFGTRETATPSMANPPSFVFWDEEEATPGQLEEAEKASPSELSISWSLPSRQLRNPEVLSAVYDGGDLFLPAYEAALGAASVGREIEPGESGRYSHCGNADGEGDSFRVYDHRTEGEIHINKRDMELLMGEREKGSSYGEAQGDATLEGAVYGLFAAEDLTHPDGKTGIVYRANQLTSIAVTDRDGNASFLAYTEAPGRTYDYKKGEIVDTGDGWGQKAPGNLYCEETYPDDYTGDGKYHRSYYNSRSENGNDWIGRPLLLGSYYIKELSRSEGYELSVGNRKQELTNRGQFLDSGVPEGGRGYARIAAPFMAEEQTEEEGEGARGNELFFASASMDTENQQYDVVLRGLPEGVRVYRKETGVREEQITVGTGVYEAVPVMDAQGNPVYVRAERDGQYPRYEADGSPAMRETPAVCAAGAFRQVAVRELDEDLVSAVLFRAEPGMTEEENEAMLKAPYGIDTYLFVKAKTEAALRRNRKATPGRKEAEGILYSSLEEGIFDRGIRADAEEQTGKTAGEDGGGTIFGAPVQEIEVKKNGVGGGPITAGEAVVAILDFYNQNPFYSYGGVDGWRETQDSYVFLVYASVAGNPENFMVLGSDPETDSVIYHRVSWIPERTSESPRYIYAAYSNKEDAGAFGTYGQYRQGQSGSSVLADAVLVPDAEADGDGKLISRMRKENVYYEPGEIVCAPDGHPLQAVEYREKTETVMQKAEQVRWCEVPVVRKPDGTYVIRVRASYTDGFGISHSNAGREQVIEWKAVLKEPFVSLSPEEADSLGNGFPAGHPMNSASYWTRVRNARAQAFLDWNRQSLEGENTYIRTVCLEYPGQEGCFQDGSTRNQPIGVEERIIRQRVRVIKDIARTEQGQYENNTQAESGHQDSFTLGNGSLENAAAAIPNFRFKLYLKSNLERLYRDEKGEICWVSRIGEETDAEVWKAGMPDLDERYAPVWKFYTKVPHHSWSETSGAVNNNVWKEAAAANGELYSRGADGFLKDERNGGYTRLLEEIPSGTEGEDSGSREPVWNYAKFFDAIAVANRDKWDRRDPLSTSFKPLVPQSSETARENARRSDAVRQFAVTWYLKEEVKKKTEKNEAGNRQPLGGSAAYQEEVYDRALYAAILKAEDYLKPFFDRDLDELYAIAWDSAPEGGRDGDVTTLSADTRKEAENAAEPEVFCEGISRYLPYGTYVAVEQQPYCSAWGDFENRHYEVDEPREVLVPFASEKSGEPAQEFFYDASALPNEMAERYEIRMNEEWEEMGGEDRRCHVIRAHNRDGDFEIYKYGLSFSHRTGTIDYPGGHREYAGFLPVQEPFDPYKDLYSRENEKCRYPANLRVGQYYWYGSLAEMKRKAGGRQTITGSLTGVDGRYFSALVPNSLIGEREVSCVSFRNRLYSTVIRVEKLDAETGENILHDGAVFAIYSALRRDGENSGGEARFYKADTSVTGSREFLEAMGAREIRPVSEMEWFPSRYPWRPPYEGLYTGIIPAGTPMALEKEPVWMKDETGVCTGVFRAYSTLRDNGGNPERQQTGYLETPEPLGAGVYVLCELDAPAGYVKSRPVAVEVYSDEVMYYQNGMEERRVRAVDYGDLSRVYVTDMPICLSVRKVKQDDKTISFEMNERREGSLTELAAAWGLENLELAWNDSGTYLGYGWPRGFLDYLQARKEAGEEIEILYEDGIFTGKAILSRTPDTADDENRFLPGAVMTLYDAIPIIPNGDIKDKAFSGVNVVRDSFGNVTRMYVQKGYAGRQTIFVREKEGELPEYQRYHLDDAVNDRGRGNWISRTVEREDTDILFYDLGDLEVFQKIGGRRMAFDREGNQITPRDGMSVFAQKGGRAFLEIQCQEYENLHYSEKERQFEQVPEKTEIYHLDENGNRDACVDPYTGMAYTVEEKTGKRLVWPVTISRDSYGNVISREKIKTGRIASVHADTEKEYTIGTFDGNRLLPQLNPIVSENGLPEYYQRSRLLYRKGTPVYDRDGDYVRYRYTDLLRNYNQNAWEMQDTEGLSDIGASPEKPGDDVPLYHRQGESFLMENTWVTGEAFPNDPFQTEKTAGQEDRLKRIPAGNYILEEIKTPSGYAPCLPQGISVKEDCSLQTVRAVNRPITAVFEKLDAPETYKRQILDRDGILGEDTPRMRMEGKGSYTYRSLPGTELCLFRARRVPSLDREKYPKGYYLEKRERDPASWNVFGKNNEEKTVTARWTVGDTPEFLEGIPAGDYILEETKTLPGYLPESIEVEISPRTELQRVTVPNDHIKVEISKYEEKNGKKVPISNENAAILALYRAKTDSQEGGPDQAEHLSYDESDKVAEWKTEDAIAYSRGPDSFAVRYQELFQTYGPAFGMVSWTGDRGMDCRARKEEEQATERGESVRQLWDLGNGSMALVQVTRNRLQEGTFGWEFDFKFNYKIEHGVISYDTPEGRHRLDCLPLTDGKKGYYVLVEIKTPAGYRTAAPKAVVIEETADIQLYGMKNETRYVYFDKRAIGGEVEGSTSPQVAGAVLVVYRAAKGGVLLKKPEYEIDRWVSGEDGVYTEADRKEGLILPGAAEGDLRYHRISPMADGIYYLTEETAPAGFIPMDPLRFEVHAGSPDVVTAENYMKKGIIRIEKKDALQAEKKLSGAVFNGRIKETGEVFSIVTDQEGMGESRPLKTGKTDRGGRWVPYHFEIRETVPPDGYQTSLEILTGVFSEQEKQELEVVFSVSDMPTRIWIDKINFETGMLVKGAKLCVREAVLAEGVYRPGGSVEAWESTGRAHLLEGVLMAGHTYFLIEEEAPEGYGLCPPKLFTISDDGRRISGVSDSRMAVSVEKAAGMTDAVREMNIQGRKALRIFGNLRDTVTGRNFRVSGNDPYVREEDGFKEGRVYELTQTVVFSDGQEETVERLRFPLIWENKEGETGTGRCRLPLYDLGQTCLELEERTRGKLEAWEVCNTPGNGYGHTILNPEYERPFRLQVASLNGAGGSALRPGAVVIYEIFCRAEEDVKSGQQIQIELDGQLAFMPANSTEGGTWKQEETGGKSQVTYELKGMKKGEKRIFSIAAAVHPKASGEVRVMAFWEKEQPNRLEAVNPVAGGGTLTIASGIMGTAERELKKLPVTYQIKLIGRDGTELPGKVAYRGTGDRRGFIKSGESIIVSGGDYVTLNGLPWGTEYRVTAHIPETDGLETAFRDTEGVIGKEGKTALWELRKNDPAIRDRFRKGEHYCLKEQVELWLDGNSLLYSTGALSFSLNDEAAVAGIGMENRPSRTVFRKTDLAGKELPRAEMTIRDSAGEVVERWISGLEDHEITARLIPGEIYTLTEEYAPDGWAYAEAISFTVSPDGAVDRVWMKDSPTQVTITKRDITGQKELPGAKLELRDKNGQLVDAWVSGEHPHVITGRLTAGEEYQLIEISPPDGYWKAETIVFRVSRDGGVDRVVMKDAPTQVYVEKRGMEAEGTKESGFLSGALLRITDEFGKTVTEWESSLEPKMVSGILKAGGTYCLEEIEAPVGYETAEPVFFKVPEDGTVLTISMTDRKLPVKGEREPEPDRPGSDLKEGWISVHVGHALSGEGRIHLPKSRLTALPRLGDGPAKDAEEIVDYGPSKREAPPWGDWSMALGLLGFVWFGALLLQRRKKECE